ncbi:MAG: hypothetical protein H0V60_11900 [Actinobacteria bacterium]|nr:hypothetical protein [Actinomycetota bacterium]
MQTLRRDRAAEHGGQEGMMRWVVGAAVAAVALLGLLIIVALVAVALQPPDWAQTLLGAVMAFGAASFAWLVASALDSSRKEHASSPPRLVSSDDKRPQNGSRRTA